MALYIDGQAVTNPTIRVVGGIDGSGNMQAMAMDAGGKPQVVVTSSVAAAGDLKPVNTLVNNAATDSLGVKLTTNPTNGKAAMVVGISVFHTVGGAASVIDVVLVSGGTDFTIDRFAAGVSEARQYGIALEDGDNLEIEVTTAGAASSTADLMVSYYEQV